MSRFVNFAPVCTIFTQLITVDVYLIYALYQGYKNQELIDGASRRQSILGFCW